MDLCNELFLASPDPLPKHNLTFARAKVEGAHQLHISRPVLPTFGFVPSPNILDTARMVGLRTRMICFHNLPGNA